MTSESHLSADEVHIEQLEVCTRIGVPEEERAITQRLKVSVSFWPHRQTGDLADNIQHAVDYSTVAEEIKTFVSGKSTSLIETLTDQLAAHLLQKFPLRKVTVEVRKFALQDAKHVSVIVTRVASVG